MKQLILLTAISISLFSCTSSTDKKEKENLAIVRSYKEAVETNNVAMIDSLLASNYKGYGPSVSDSVNKEGAIENWKYNSANLYESFQFSRVQSLAKTVEENEEVIKYAIENCNLELIEERKFFYGSPGIQRTFNKATLAQRFEPDVHEDCQGYFIAKMERKR